MAGTHDIARDVGMKDTQVKAVFNAILARVKNGERVLIKDHGTYEQKHVAERMIKSPQLPNGEAKMVAHDVLKFRASPVTKKVLNGQAEMPSNEDTAEEAPAPAPKPAPKAAAPKAAPAPAKPAVAKPAAPAAKPAAAAPKAAAPAAKPAAPAAKKPAPKPAPVEETEEASE